MAKAYQENKTRQRIFTRLTPQDKLGIIDAYKINLEPMVSIANRYKKSFQAIWKMLKKEGVDTTKNKIEVSCATCGKVLKRHKYRLRTNKNHFCDMTCYQSFLTAGASHFTSNERRKGGKRARAIVSQHFNLQPGHVVHHEDGFPLNNQLWNLRVFATNGDHIRYHHQARDIYNKTTTTPAPVIDIEPIWDGSKINQ